MKKLLAILLIILYASLNSIEVIGMHFCHGKLVDIALNQPPESCCGDDVAFSAPCCDEVTIEVEMDEDKLVNQNLNPEPVKSIDLIAFFQTYSLNEQLSVSETYEFVDTSPPGESQSELYLLNQSLVFYS